MVLAKRKSVAVGVLAGVLLLLLLGACGRSTSPAGEGAAAEAPAPEQAAPAEQATTPPEATVPPATATPAPEPTAAPIQALRVGVNAQFKPFAFKDDAGKLVGFDIELMDAIAATAGVEVGFTDVPFAELFAGLDADQFDAAISALTITPDRQQNYDFTTPYFGANQALVSYLSAGQGIAVRSDGQSITGLDGLTGGLRTGVKFGTTGAAFVADQTDAEVIPFDEAEPALAALSAGEVDAVVVDIPVIVHYIKTHPDAGLQLAGGPITEELYAIAVAKGDAEVLALLNDALIQLSENGTYDAIFTRWFGAP